MLQLTQTNDHAFIVALPDCAAWREISNGVNGSYPIKPSGSGVDPFKVHCTFGVGNVTSTSVSIFMNAGKNWTHWSVITL